MATTSQQGNLAPRGDQRRFSKTQGFPKTLGLLHSPGGFPGPGRANPPQQATHLISQHSKALQRKQSNACRIKRKHFAQSNRKASKAKQRNPKDTQCRPKKSRANHEAKICIAKRGNEKQDRRSKASQSKAKQCKAPQIKSNLMH